MQDATRLYAGVRSAAMNDEREKVRKSIRLKRQIEQRLKHEAAERERRCTTNNKIYCANVVFLFQGD